MERTTLFQDDLTEERTSTPVAREEASHSLALDPDVADDDDDDEDEDEDENEDLDD